MSIKHNNRVKTLVNSNRFIRNMQKKIYMYLNCKVYNDYIEWNMIKYLYYKKKVI